MQNDAVVQKMKIAAMGECMLELSLQSASSWKMGHGGDTFNVAFYLNHYTAPAHFDIQYITALGMDIYSEEMLRAWENQGIGTDWVLRLPQGKPGLYLINTDAQGERNFFYYRNEAAARQLFQAENAQRLQSALLDFHAIYFSGITLAILDSPSRKRLQHLLKEAKNQGVLLVFDTNYRPALWQTKEEAQAAVLEILPYVNVALPTFEDHQNLFDVPTPEACAEHLHEQGVAEVVVKCGAAPCLVSESHQNAFWVPAQAVQTVVDTSGAGDSFNAGYLLGRLHQKGLELSATLGHRLAAEVIQHPGVLLDSKKCPSLF